MTAIEDILLDNPKFIELASSIDLIYQITCMISWAEIVDDVFGISRRDGNEEHTPS